MCVRGGVEDDLREGGSLLPLSFQDGSQGSNSAQQTWQQAPLPTEPSLWPHPVVVRETASLTGTWRSRISLNGQQALGIISSLLPLKLQVHTAMPGFFTWTLGSKLRSLCYGTNTLLTALSLPDPDPNRQASTELSSEMA